MNMHKVRYSFTRGDNLAAISSTNSASTDALNALQTWVKKHSRSYEEQEDGDEDDKLVADLKFDEKDKLAGPELDNACETNGIERNFICNV